jgi:alkyldihydroxyacetonephosphate synthase
MTTDLGPGAPTPPIPVPGGSAGPVRLAPTVELGEALLGRLRDACVRVDVDDLSRTEASRDWWPLAMGWAVAGERPALAAAVARPTSVEEVCDVLAVCNEAVIPVTAAGGRSGVCGASVPAHGGVVLDLCGLRGIREVDQTSLILDVGAGTFGDHLEHELRSTHAVTVGHWPQSVALSTVGGWLACRGAGQYSGRYGKIEDIVAGLDVVLADGRFLRTGGGPRAAVGPDLTQLFVGSEGTLGVITGARLRVHRVPGADIRRAFAFPTFAAGMDACRRIVQRGATPAVVRLYDAIEAKRNYDIDAAVLLVLDEADPAVLTATAAVVDAECAAADPLDASLVDRWLDHRNDTSALQVLTSKGFVVDTMEVAGPWGVLEAVHCDVINAISAVDGTRAVSVHQSHSYPGGACLYFTFGGLPGGAGADAYYRAVWDAGTHAALHAGARLSHHHGVGLNRSRFMAAALGDTGVGVLGAVKAALDPTGILNPGKLGLPDPFGVVTW